MRAPPRLLLLGGTAEAILTAHALARHVSLIYSLAGATSNPKTPQGVKVRVGGFGGVPGLKAYCQQHGVTAILDCTHPFASRMSSAAVASGLPVLRLERPAWSRVRGDRWLDVPHLHAAAARLRHHSGPIALALGRGGEPLAQRLGSRAILRRWHPDLVLDDPIAEADWLHQTRAKILVAKNSGGSAFGKLVAARRLKLPVMMIQRPNVLGGEVFHDLGWLVRTVLHRYC